MIHRTPNLFLKSPHGEVLRLQRSSAEWIIERLLDNVHVVHRGVIPFMLLGRGLLDESVRALETAVQ
eukprot:87941-Amphidinium_carterae.1